MKMAWYTTVAFGTVHGYRLGDGCRVGWRGDGCAMVVQNAQPPPKEEYRMRSRESAGVRGGESKKRRSVCKNDTIAYRPPRGTEGAGRQPCHDGTIA